jgi:hypothetical protein
MASVIVGDATQALSGQMDHLVLPHVGVQSPTVNENDGLAGPPVLAEEHGAIAHFEKRHGERLASRVHALGAAGPDGLRVGGQ